MTSYLQLVRERTKSATDRTDKTLKKGRFVSFGSSPSGALPVSEPDQSIIQAEELVSHGLMPNLNTQPREYGEWAAKQLMAQKSYPVGADLHRTWDVMRDGKHFCCMVTDYCMQSEAIKSARFHWPDAYVVPWQQRDV